MPFTTGTGVLSTPAHVSPFVTSSEFAPPDPWQRTLPVAGSISTKVPEPMVPGLKKAPAEIENGPVTRIAVVDPKRAGGVEVQILDVAIRGQREVDASRNRGSSRIDLDDRVAVGQQEISAQQCAQAAVAGQQLKAAEESPVDGILHDDVGRGSRVVVDHEERPGDGIPGNVLGPVRKGRRSGVGCLVDVVDVSENVPTSSHGPGGTRRL
jgi:hypothetical protein